MRAVYFKGDLTDKQKFLLLPGIIQHRLSGRSFEEVDKDMYLASGMAKEIVDQFRPMIEKLIIDAIDVV